MISIHTPRLLATVLGLLLLALPARGQEATPDTAVETQAAPTEQEQAVALLETIRNTDGELIRLIGDLPAAEGENLDLLRTQIGELADQQHQSRLVLVDLISTREAAGADVTLLEQQTEHLMRRSSRRLRSYVQALQDALEREATRRETLTPDEFQLYEHRMAEATGQLDRFYMRLSQLTDEMAAFGLRVGDEQEFLGHELTERGQNLLRLLDLTRKQRAEYKQLLKNAPGDTKLQEQVFASEERYDSNKASLLATIHILKTLGLDYTALEVRLLELTGEVTPEALETEVALGLFERWLIRAKVYLSENGPKLLLRLLVILGILLVFWIVARFSKRIASNVLDKTKISTSKLLKEMVVSMVGRVVMIVGIILVLPQLGINLGPVLAGFGIAGVVIGFALQDTLSNFAAGAMILAYRPYDVGDFVEAAGVTGKVRDMNLVSTRILTVDHQTLIVPNSKIWGDVIRNVTAQPQRRVDMVFGISYEDEIPKAEQVLEEIVDAHDKVLSDPEPMIKVHALNESSVDFIVRPWAKTADYWDVYWDITREVKMRFDREGISIPYPQRDVHHDEKR